MRRNLIETVVAGVVLVIAGAFLFFALNEVQPKREDGYPLFATFDNGTDLKAGADVQIAGVAVGRVMSVALDNKRFEVEVAMQIRATVRLPRDTRARITTDGLMGGGIVQLLPGGAHDGLEPGARIRDTESPVNIVDQFGRFIYSGGPSAPDANGGSAPLDDF